MGIYIGGSMDGQAVEPSNFAASQVMCGSPSATYSKIIWTNEGGPKHIFFVINQFNMELKPVVDRITEWLEKN